MTRFRAASVLIAALAFFALESRADADHSLLLVTTTSVRDSGLFEALLPVFRERTGISVQLVAIGSGAALRMGADGNADVLVTHAPGGEKALLASGGAVSRIPFMENYFVIAGPAEDPAGIRMADSPADALRRIAAAHAAFASRSDDSGTHRREVALMVEAGLDPQADWEGLSRTGSGMGLTLQVAGQRRAYVLSDIGTFLAFQQRVNLERLSVPAPSLRNVYSVLRIDPERLEPARAKRARQFEAFLLDVDIQRRIRNFGTARYGRPLFSPLHLAGNAVQP